MSNQQGRELVTEEHLTDLLNSRENTDPVPVLTHRAEDRISRQLREVALKGCEANVRALAECAEGRLLSVVWHCRSYSKAVDACMKSFAKDDALRDELKRRHGAKYPQAVKGYKQSSNQAVKEEATL